MGLELTTDKYPPITSQTRYPLRHAASKTVGSFKSQTVSFRSQFLSTCVKILNH